MSHVTTIEIEIKDLKCLKEAAAACGLEFREGQQTYKWYGRHMGDYALPEGFTADQLGKCDHALSVPGNDAAYEIGVVANKDGTFTLLYDFWGKGYGLMEKVSTDGQTCGKLAQEYQTAVTKRQLKRQGFRFREVRENGKVRLVTR